MAELDPTVQTKLIELAEKMASSSVGSGISGEAFHSEALKYFDKYYKALAKTVLG